MHTQPWIIWLNGINDKVLMLLWRKRCFGTQSKQGSLFVERILTTVLTSRKQNRDVLEFLTQACNAKNGATHVPSLLPTN
jgi:hypothetical protein